MTWINRKQLLPLLIVLTFSVNGCKKKQKSKENPNKAFYKKACANEISLRKWGRESKSTKNIIKGAHKCAESNLKKSEIYKAGEYDKHMQCILDATSREKLENCYTVRMFLTKKEIVKPEDLRPMGKVWLRNWAKKIVPKKYELKNYGHHPRRKSVYLMEFRGPLSKNKLYEWIILVVNSCGKQCKEISMKKAEQRWITKSTRFYKGITKIQYKVYLDTINSVETLIEWIHGFNPDEKNPEKPPVFDHEVSIRGNRGGVIIDLSIGVDFKKGVKLSSNKQLHDFAPRKEMEATALSIFTKMVKTLP